MAAEGSAADRLLAAFRERVGREPAGVWSAPGRANLIGEHLDYNGGVVVPFALPLRTRVGAATRPDGRIRCWSLQADDAVGNAADVAIDAAREVTGWPGYVAGTVWALRRAGCQVRGMDVVVDGDVPLGGGLSSSAALECAVALACDELSAAGADRMLLARAGQLAEHEVLRAPVGLMDQVASLFGRPGEAVVFDTAHERLDRVVIPLEGTGSCLIVVNTGVTHDIAAGEYADRRRACERAAARLGVRHLAHAAAEDLEALADDPQLLARARHVVTEQARVRAAIDALAAPDMPAVGGLLTASHASLRDDYEVSVPELDGAVEAAVGAGALGARLTGGGFGGCVLVLAPLARRAAVVDAVRRRAAAAGWPRPAFYDGRPSGGGRREL